MAMSIECLLIDSAIGFLQSRTLSRCHNPHLAVAKPERSNVMIVSSLGLHDKDEYSLVCYLVPPPSAK